MKIKSWVEFYYSESSAVVEVEQFWIFKLHKEANYLSKIEWHASVLQTNLNELVAFHIAD